jgi:hypothetical protein
MFPKQGETNVKLTQSLVSNKAACIAPPVAQFSASISKQALDEVAVKANHWLFSTLEHQKGGKEMGVLLMV